MSRILAIPDIHGRYDLLVQLLDQIMPLVDLTDGDKIVVLGDMIDRGPDSSKVIQWLMRSQSFWGKQNFVCLLGNHEDFMLQCLADPNRNNQALWFMNGGIATAKSFGALIKGKYFENTFVPEAVAPEVGLWLRSLPLSHREPGFFFSHAPVPRENRRNYKNKGKEYTRHELIWTYHADESGVANRFEDGTIGVCGHIHRLRYGTMEPRFYDHYIFADAGCGCSDKAPLVAIEVRTRQVWYARPT